MGRTCRKARFRHVGPNFCGPDWQLHGTAVLPESLPDYLLLHTSPCARWREWEPSFQRVYLQVVRRIWFQRVLRRWAMLYVHHIEFMKL